jgi:hypothetical protein
MKRSFPRGRAALSVALSALCFFLGPSRPAAGPPPASTAAGVDPLTPGDACVLLVVDVRQLLAAPLVKKHALEGIGKALARSERVGEALRAAGLDPLRDVDTLTLAVSGDWPHPHVLAVVRGRFDPAKARAAATDYARHNPAELQLEPDGGRVVYQAHAHGQTTFAAFADGGALLVSTKREDLAAALARPDGSPAPLSGPMRSALAKLDGKEPVRLAVVITDRLKETIRRKDPDSAALAASLECVTGALEVTDAFRLTLAAHTTSPAAALQLRQKVEDVLPLLQLLAAGPDQGARLLKEAIDGIEVDTRGSAARLRVKVTEEMIRKSAAARPGG